MKFLLFLNKIYSSFYVQEVKDTINGLRSISKDDKVDFKKLYDAFNKTFQSQEYQKLITIPYFKNALAKIKATGSYYDIKPVISFIANEETVTYDQLKNVFVNNLLDIDDFFDEILADDSFETIIGHLVDTDQFKNVDDANPQVKKWFIVTILEINKKNFNLKPITDKFGEIFWVYLGTILAIVGSFIVYITFKYIILKKKMKTVSLTK